MMETNLPNIYAVGDVTNTPAFVYTAAFFIDWSAYGRGSYPCPPQGWHLLTRFAVSQNPFIGPYFLNASMPYCEQVGLKRHEGANRGLIQY